jgi:hypothetical protein
MKISEAAFMAQIKAIAFTYGWMTHHSQPSMTRTGRYITTGSAGFPDLVLAHPEKGFLLAEIKTDIGRVSAQQIEWLKCCDPHIECYIWRPRDLPEITARLARKIDRRSG